MPNEVEDIKSKLNIVDVIGEYMPLKKAGVNFRARCPFHSEKSPSFYVSPVRQIWHCFGCSLGGDMFEFVKQLEGVDFRQALEKLAEKAGVILPDRSAGELASRDSKRVLYDLNLLAAKFYHQVLLQSPKAGEARDYLSRRKFLPATIKAWQIGYAPEMWDALYAFLKKRNYQDADMVAAGLIIKRDRPEPVRQSPPLADGGGYFDRFRDRITFPIHDGSGKIVGFSARVLRPKEGVGKYINSPESPVYNKSQVIYGYFQARTEIRKRDLAVVVEGNVDVVKSHQAGIANVVASSGTALTEPQLLRLSNLTRNLTLAFDADSAGVAAARRAAELAVAKGFTLRLIRAPKGFKDADEMIDQDPQLWRKVVDGAQDFLDFYFHKLFDILPSHDAQAKSRAVEEFLALLAKVPAPVVVAHYIHEVALAANIKDQVVADLYRRKFTPAVKSAAPGPKQSAQKISAEEILERQFLGILLKSPKERLDYYIKKHEPAHFTVPDLRKIHEALSAHIQRAPDYDFERFTSGLDDGLKTAVNLAVFSVEIGDKDEGAEVSELRELSKRLALKYLHRCKDDLARELTQAERMGKIEDKLRLALEFNQVINKIGEIEN